MFGFLMLFICRESIKYVNHQLLVSSWSSSSYYLKPCFTFFRVTEKHFPFIHSVKHMLVVLVKIRDPVGLLQLEPKLSDKVNLQLFGLNLVYTA